MFMTMILLLMLLISIRLFMARSSAVHKLNMENRIHTEELLINMSYLQNIRQTINSDQMNSIILKVIYYLIINNYTKTINKN